MELWWVWLLVGIAVLLGVLAVVGYNRLVRRRIRCREAWSQIDVQLKRRHDLVPNLVNTVKGYAAHERETLEAVIQARNAAVAAQGVKQQEQAENMLTGALRQLFALSESYPQLQANQNFSQLQEELTSTENRIAFSRQHYNDSVAVYNTVVQQFPTNVLAGMFGFRNEEYFEIEEPGHREAPKVEF